MDTLGLIQALVVHEADFQDYEGAWLVFALLAEGCPRLKKLWADSRYQAVVKVAERVFGWDLEIVKRRPEAVGFEVQPKRWIVERTLAWLGRYRRLSKEYEEQTASSEAMIYLAMTHRMVRWLCPS